MFRKLDRVRVVRKVYTGVKIGDEGTVVGMKRPLKGIRPGVVIVRLDKDAAKDPDCTAGFEPLDLEAF